MVLVSTIQACIMQTPFQVTQLNQTKNMEQVVKRWLLLTLPLQMVELTINQCISIKSSLVMEVKKSSLMLGLVP